MNRILVLLAVALGTATAGTAVYEVTTGWPGAVAPPAGRTEAPDVGNIPYDGRFVFVRVMYQPTGPVCNADIGGRRREPPWCHDFDRAEQHFTKILSELSTISAYQGGGNRIALDDPELTRYPVAYMSEPGYWTLSPSETEGMRNYLLKGGFMIFDDFAGEHWYNFQERIQEVLPDAQLVKLDPSYPIFDSFFRIASLDYQHPYYRGYQSEFFGIFEDNDPAKRLMVIINYNNDIAEYWEWSDTDWAPIELSNEAYKLGVNYIIYAMTH